MEHTFKEHDPVTVVDGSNWLIDKRAIVVKVLEKAPDDFPEEEKDHTIIVRFPDIPLMNFNDFLNDDIPEHEKGWVCFAPYHLTPGHKPLSEQEQIEYELKGFGPHMQPVYCKQLPSRIDGTCACEGCANVATTHIWFNLHASGYRYHVCDVHAKKYGSCTCCDDIPFAAKELDHPKKEVA